MSARQKRWNLVVGPHPGEQGVSGIVLEKTDRAVPRWVRDEVRTVVGVVEMVSVVVGIEVKTGVFF